MEQFPAATPLPPVSSVVLDGGRHHFHLPGQTVPDSGVQYTFSTADEARAYLWNKVDTPTESAEIPFGSGASLRRYSYNLSGGRFTNVYDLSYAPEAVAAEVCITPGPQSVVRTLEQHPYAIAAASGAFLYLVDSASGVPRQSALNMALQPEGVLASVPVTDQEALIAEGGHMTARKVRACGRVAIGGTELRWRGSRTVHPAEAEVFANGNVVVTHQHTGEWNARKERIRALDDSSRYTPLPREAGKRVDVGLIAQRFGRFAIASVAPAGGVNMFPYDAVLRCPKGVLTDYTDSEVRFLEVDTVSLDGSVQGAISVGPLLSEPDFAAHAINRDPSLGSDAPFVRVPMVRQVVYQTLAGRMHVRLFDGRPESDVFRGVTPQEAVDEITAAEPIAWGCFLDPGRTAKLITRSGNDTMSYGNAHYLQWPTEVGAPYVWVPAGGRPVPSALTFTPRG